MRAKQKVKKCKKLIKKWVSKQGHDKCWYYPKIFLQLANILNIEGVYTPLMPIEQFQEGCNQFQKELYE